MAGQVWDPRSGPGMTGKFFDILERKEKFTIFVV